MSRILIVGGDMRNVCLARMLREKGCDVGICGINADIFSPGEATVFSNVKKCVSDAEIIILPLIMSADNITVNTPLFDGCIYLRDICQNAGKDALVFGGRVNSSVFNDYDIKIHDYAIRDDFASLNAVPTAEGAIEAVMKILPVTIFSSKILVTGFGKCAKVLSLTLRAMGADVWISARGIHDLSLAEAFGMNTVHISDMHRSLGDFDAVFNTIPHTVFKLRELSAMKEETPLIDIASSPGGAERALVRECKIKYMFLPGIPGKYSPVTAAEIILKTIVNIIVENGKDAKQWIYGEKG